MASNYDPAVWARGTKLGRRVYNHNFRLGSDALADWSLAKTVTMMRKANHAETTFLWQRPDKSERELVQANVTELNDWRAAQKQLRALLGQSMRPEIPLATAELAKLGDVAFVGRDPDHDMPAAVYFARGNVAVTTRSVGGLAVDVSMIALAIDGLLSETDGPPGRAAAPIERRRLTLKPARARAATVLDIDLGAADVWLKVVASSGELRRRARTIVHVASGSDEVRVDLVATRP